MLGIVSSNVRANVAQAFRNGGCKDLATHLDVFCGLDNAPSKDKGETLAAILKEIGVEGANAVYVGDTIKDYKHSCLCNGMQFVGVSYGFDDLVAAKEEGTIAQNTPIAETPEQLMRILTDKVKLPPP